MKRIKAGLNFAVPSVVELPWNEMNPPQLWSREVILAFKMLNFLSISYQ